MPYDLNSRGFADFVRLGTALDQQDISLDPLSGILDGVNTKFHTNYFPVLTSGSLGVYVNGTLTPGTANYNTGEVTLVTPPAYQPFATYITTPYTSTQILQFVIKGFDEMELRWSRGWQLLDGLGAWADENSANVYVVDGSGNDPTTGSISFSQSRVQIAFFMACCEYRFVKTQMRTSAAIDYMWRESVRGMTVDKSRVPANLKLVADMLLEDLLEALEEAQDQQLNGDQYGAFISSPATLDYMGNFDWATESKAQDYRGTFGYNVGLRSLSYP